MRYQRSGKKSQVFHNEGIHANCHAIRTKRLSQTHCDAGIAHRDTYIARCHRPLEGDERLDDAVLLLLHDVEGRRQLIEGEGVGGHPGGINALHQQYLEQPLHA